MLGLLTVAVPQERGTSIVAGESEWFNMYVNSGSYCTETRAWVEEAASCPSGNQHNLSYCLVLGFLTSAVRKETERQLSLPYCGEL